jgi:membrane protease YdiL (CAAX protease family)
MRRLVRGDFERTSFREVGLSGLWVSAIAFGVVHGRFWSLGIFAGLVFGLLAIRTNRFGEAVMAHVIANALLATCVLSMNQWQLW